MYVTAEHPHGGRQSICEVRNRLNANEFGYTIAKFLNDAWPETDMPDEGEKI